MIPEGAGRDAVEFVHVVGAECGAQQAGDAEEHHQQLCEFLLKYRQQRKPRQAAEKQRYAGDLTAHRRVAQVVKSAVETVRLAQMHIQFEQSETHECDQDAQQRQPGAALPDLLQGTNI